VLHFATWIERSRIARETTRYVISIASVSAALLTVSALNHFSVRDPVVLIYLTAIAVSFWLGQRGPGILAFSLATICVFGHFLEFENSWVHLACYDGPVLALYFAFTWWIQSFAGSRHSLEQVLRHNGEELETAVKTRTAEMNRLNAESKVILDAAPFGIALLSLGRIVERCNPEYERMLGYGPGELSGMPAPLPEEQREAWNKHEELLRSGQRIVEYDAIRMRHDGTRFSATIWMTPLQDCRGNYRGLVGFILDNTERNAREAERQMLSALVEHSPDLVAVTDEAWRLTFINTAGSQLLGLNAGNDLSLIDITSRFGTLEQVPGSVSLPCEQGHLNVETTYQEPASGEAIHLHCTSFIIPSAKPGDPVLRAFVAQDISERKESETKLRVSLDENGRLLEENKALQEKLQRENISLQERNLALQSEIADIQRARFEKIIGESPALRRTLSKVEQVASTNVTVLITGETGTGKELIAQAIHENSKRAHMPFRAINCAAFPATLMASELFGHERGAFTGADRQRLGQFELASGGTLFLDEIGELPLETQAMLLRVLEEHTFERLGGTKPIRSDVRIIVATNRDLHTGMQKGEFRRDLFFRLSGFPIEVPALRERKGDIPHLVQHFVEISAARHGKRIRNIEKRAMEMLLAYSWPGNIRELRNVIDTSVIVSPGENLVVDEELLFGVESFMESGTGTLKEKMDQYERSLIEHALAESRGRVAGASGAAAFLGLPPSTLSARMQALKIDVLKFKALPD